MFAMYEKHGQPLELILKHYIEVRFIKPKYRPYKTKNFYSLLITQNQLDEEVKNIVKKKQNQGSPKLTKEEKKEQLMLQ